MMQNIQGRLKMEFPHYNCFPVITKLIVGLHALHASKSRVNAVVVLKDRHFDASYLSNGCVLKYDKNSYANIGTVLTYLGNSISRNVLQYYAIIGCEKILFFFMNGKNNSLKRSP